MGKISLLLPGNTFHSNHLSSQMEIMDKERCGLKIFRKFGIPATVFFQGVDFLLKPWLRDEMKISGSLEWGAAPFSHTLIPLIGENWKEEINNGIEGQIPVCFFSEFYPPEGSQISTDFTLALVGNSALYSASAEFRSLQQGDINVQDYPDTHSIRFEDKIALLLREELFGPFLKAFFLFQRYPNANTQPEGKDCLQELIIEVRKIAMLPENQIVLCPLDLEAPWVGSCFGANVWEIFFTELANQKLTEVFTPLSHHLDRFAYEARETSRPHRDLNKWTNWEIQLTHMDRLKKSRAKNEGELIVRMIATGSDIFAAWGIKIRESKRRIILETIRPDGQTTQVPITFNQRIIDVQLSAYNALKKETTFLEQLNQIQGEDYFVSLAKGMAERLSL